MSESLSIAEAELRALMLAALAGDGNAQHTLLTQLADRLRQFYRRRLGRDAADVEDLVQEALIAIHTRRETYDPAQPLTGWVYAIARYKLADCFRRSQRRVMVSLDECEELFGADDNEQASAVHDVQQVMVELSAQQRDAIQMTRIEGLSIEEAAQRSGSSESLIKVSVHRGMKRLLARYAAKNEVTKTK